MFLSFSTSEPPIKRFAQRHSTRKIDAIASRDLGVALARQSTSSSFGSGSLVRTETASSVLAGLNINQSTSNDGARSAPSGPTAERNKRPSSPATRGRDDSVHKRQRAHSPPPHSAPPPHVRDRDRGREGPPPRRRFQSPSFEREGGRDGHGPPRREREDAGEKPVTLPPIISWFVGTLPTPASFEGRLNPLLAVVYHVIGQLK
jgi:cleavage stimulation factor subunit 3